MEGDEVSAGMVKFSCQDKVSAERTKTKSNNYNNMPTMLGYIE